MCVGYTATLSDGTPGGVWSTTGITIATVGAGTGVITGVSAGTAVISYALGDGCFTMATVTVNALPSPISGASTVCIGGSISLTDTASGGSWSSSTTVVAYISATTGLVTGEASGASTITYTLSDGCIATKVVTVNSIASITGPGTVCTGNNITLTSSVSGGTWSSSNTAIATVGSGLVTGVANGIAVISYSTTGCAGKDTIDVGTITGIVTNNTATTCTSPDFYVSTCGVSSSYNVTSYYGDGTSDNTALSSTSVCHADIIHDYAAPGTYTVKQVLYDGVTPMDSTTFTYNYSFCRYLPVKFYYDANQDCMMDAGEVYNPIPVNVIVDSNGVTVDTISATSGIYYEALGLPGTVYSFRVSCGYLKPSCTADSILYDTIQAVVNDYPVKYYGLYANGVGFYDLSVYSGLTTGRHMAQGIVTVSNLYPTPENAVVTANFSSNYVFGYASPTPTSVVGNTITWDINALSYSSGTKLLQFEVNVPGPWLTPGDTLSTNYSVTPVVGDVDPVNNYIMIVNTITGSWDPNNMSVAPVYGYVSSGSPLQYTINFENTGNDTAFNISVYDTLPNTVNANSLRILAASAVMNTTIINDGTYNVVKFDFPGINLLDSTHHNQCNGMVVFSVNTLSGLPTCTTIANEAGIYFDYNAVVMTNQVQSIIGTAPALPAAIAGVDSVCVGFFFQLSDASSGGTWSVSNSNANIYAGDITGVTPGTDTVYYTITNACGTPTTTQKVVTVLTTADCITGIHTPAANTQSIDIYPNPAGNQITISSSGQIDNIIITDLLGQAVISRQPAYRTGRFAVGNLQTIDVSALPGGVYFVKVNNTEVRKFVKE